MISSRIQKYTETEMAPSSLFSQSILKRNRLNKIAHILVSILSVAGGTFGLYEVFYGTIRSKNDRINKYIVYESVWIKSNYILVGLSCCYYLVDGALFLKFLRNYHEIIDKNREIAAEFILEQKKTLKLFGMAAISYEILCETGKVYVRYVDSSGNAKNFIIRYLINVMVLMPSKITLLSQFQFILEICVHLESAFIVHNYHLNHIELTTQSTDSQMIKPEEKINSCRLMYTKIIETTKIIDRFLLSSLIVFYLLLIGLCLFIVRALFIEQSILSLILTIFRSIGETIYLIVITYYLVRVNQLSNELFDKVYSLTFNIESVEFTNQVITT